MLTGCSYYINLNSSLYVYIYFLHYWYYSGRFIARVIRARLP
jgi:hypothetical protein